MMKNLNIMGAHLKMRFWGERAVGGGRGGVHEKSIYRGELPKKGELGQFSD